VFNIHMTIITTTPFNHILITGTTTGIGADLSRWFGGGGVGTVVEGNTPSNLYHGNRRDVDLLDTQHIKHHQVNVDLSSKQSIDSFVDCLVERLDGATLDMLVLNAGMKATRKRVDWDGAQLNMCRVVNLIANNYLVDSLYDRGVVSRGVRIIATTSITHWTAVADPYGDVTFLEHDGTNDPTDSEWASAQYPNTKLGLFFLAHKWEKKIPDADIRLINPGMVATKIFGDAKATGLIQRTVRGVREWMSLPPNESVEIMGRWIKLERPPESTGPHITYYTPYHTNPLFGVTRSTQMLQDALGYRMLSRTNGATEPSDLVGNPDVAREYVHYMRYDGSVGNVVLDDAEL
jgi:NAD(P)-dependent dehydrogenase (short-subunit alcohol dehydrogenase family)